MQLDGSMTWDPLLLVTIVLGLGLIATSAGSMQRAFRSRKSWRIRELRRRREASRAALRASKRTNEHGADVIPLRKRPRVRGPVVASRPSDGALRSVQRVDRPGNG